MCRIPDLKRTKLIASSSSFEFDQKKIIILIIRDITELSISQEKTMNENYQNIFLLFSAPQEIRSQLNLITGNLEHIEKISIQTYLKLPNMLQGLWNKYSI